jgi:hypothetical protein
MEKAALFAASARLATPKELDVCNRIPTSALQTLATLKHASATLVPNTFGKPNSCEFQFQPGTGTRLRVDLTVKRLPNSREALEAFGSDPRRNLVHTADTSDTVSTVGPHSKSAKAMHDTTVAELEVDETDSDAGDHPSFEYHLQSAALQAAGATVVPSSSSPEIPVAQGLTIVDKLILFSISYLLVPTIILVPVLLGILCILRRRRILRTGMPGMAHVESISDTGMTLNYRPVIRMRVTVTPNAGPSFETTIRKSVSRLSAPAMLVGQSLPVRIDPKNPKRIVFVNEP